ncbi:MAG: DNA polymerase-2, partial [Paraglaciecola sp.]
PQDGGLASPGGYVMNSRPGLYRNVLVLDFKSLYPSIIRTFKIDPLGLIEGLLQPQKAITGYKGGMFSRNQHFLPDIITSLWQQRDEAKRNKDSARSQAIKILMNSFYGVLGSGGCPFYDTRLASSITLRGHDIMQTTAKWIEDAGYQVIYGDTDSTFVWLGDEMSPAQADGIGRTLQREINSRWNSKVEQEYQLTNYLEIEYETHFSRFLMPTIRGSQLGSKKRYAGLRVTEQGHELVFKGLETVRSDWTVLAKTFQLELYRRVFANEDVQAYLQTVIAATLNGQLDEQLIYHKRIRRRLDQYVKNVPPHVRAARLADEQNLALGKPLRYQYKGTIDYVITLNGPEPVEYHTSVLNYEHYVEKQIRPIAEGILPFIGLSFEQITSEQMGLF